MIRLFSRILLGTLVSMTLACQVSPSTGKQIHQTDQIYAAVGPYSQIVQAGDQYFLSGVIPLTLDGQSLVAEDIEAQTRQVLDYIAAKLSSVGLSLDDVVMSTVYMTDLEEFTLMNQVYGEYFPDSAPARATVQVAALPRGAKIEIAVIATSL